VDIPDDMKDECEAAHEEMVEKICEFDDDLMMAYLDGEEPSIDDMKKALRKATIENKAVPVLCGSAHQNKGIRSFWMLLLTSCRLRPMSRISRVQIWTEMKS
jgi:elongation factor G